MRRLVVALVVVVAIAGGAVHVRFEAHRARAGSYVADTASSPAVSLTPEALCKFWSNQAAAQGVSADPGWNTAMASIFSAANWPGVNATSLAFLRSFFVQYVHVGVP